MDTPEQNKPKLTLVKGLRGRIRELEQQMEALEQERRELDRMQRGLDGIEALLHRMAALAREAAGEELDEARRHSLSVEFEACKRRIDLLAASCGPNGKNLMLDGFAAVRAAVAALDLQLNELE